MQQLLHPGVPFHHLAPNQAVKVAADQQVYVVVEFTHNTTDLCNCSSLNIIHRATQLVDTILSGIRVASSVYMRKHCACKIKEKLIEHRVVERREQLDEWRAQLCLKHAALTAWKMLAYGVHELQHTCKHTVCASAWAESDSQRIELFREGRGVRSWAFP